MNQIPQIYPTSKSVNKSRYTSYGTTYKYWSGTDTRFFRSDVKHALFGGYSTGKISNNMQYHPDNHSGFYVSNLGYGCYYNGRDKGERRMTIFTYTTGAFNIFNYHLKTLNKTGTKVGLHLMVNYPEYNYQTTGLFMNNQNKLDNYYTATLPVNFPEYYKNNIILGNLLILPFMIFDLNPKSTDRILEVRPKENKLIISERCLMIGVGGRVKPGTYSLDLFMDIVRNGNKDYHTFVYDATYKPVIRFNFPNVDFYRRIPNYRLLHTSPLTNEVTNDNIYIGECIYMLNHVDTTNEVLYLHPGRTYRLQIARDFYIKDVPDTEDVVPCHAYKEEPLKCAYTGKHLDNIFDTFDPPYEENPEPFPDPKMSYRRFNPRVFGKFELIESVYKKYQYIFRTYISEYNRYKDRTLEFFYSNVDLERRMHPLNFITDKEMITLPCPMTAYPQVDIPVDIRRYATQGSDKDIWGVVLSDRTFKYAKDWVKEHSFYKCQAGIPFGDFTVDDTSFRFARNTTKKVQPCYNIVSNRTNAFLIPMTNALIYIHSRGHNSITYKIRKLPKEVDTTVNVIDDGVIFVDARQAQVIFKHLSFNDGVTEAEVTLTGAINGGSITGMKNTVITNELSDLTKRWLLHFINGSYGLPHYNVGIGSNIPTLFDDINYNSNNYYVARANGQEELIENEYSPNDSYNEKLYSSIHDEVSLYNSHMFNVTGKETSVHRDSWWRYVNHPTMMDGSKLKMVYDPNIIFWDEILPQLDIRPYYVTTSHPDDVVPMLIYNSRFKNVNITKIDIKTSPNENIIYSLTGLVKNASHCKFLGGFDKRSIGRTQYLHPYILVYGYTLDNKYKVYKLTNYHGSVAFGRWGLNEGRYTLDEVVNPIPESEMLRLKGDDYAITDTHYFGRPCINLNKFFSSGSDTEKFRYIPMGFGVRDGVIATGIPSRPMAFYPVEDCSWKNGVVKMTFSNRPYRHHIDGWTPICKPSIFSVTTEVVHNESTPRVLFDNSRIRITVANVEPEHQNKTYEFEMLVVTRKPVSTRSPENESTILSTDPNNQRPNAPRYVRRYYERNEKTLLIDFEQTLDDITRLDLAGFLPPPGIYGQNKNYLVNNTSEKIENVYRQTHGRVEWSFKILQVYDDLPVFQNIFPFRPISGVQTRVLTPTIESTYDNNKGYTIKFRNLPLLVEGDLTFRYTNSQHQTITTPVPLSLLVRKNIADVINVYDYHIENINDSSQLIKSLTTNPQLKQGELICLSLEEFHKQYGTYPSFDGTIIYVEHSGKVAKHSSFFKWVILIKHAT